MDTERDTLGRIVEEMRLSATRHEHYIKGDLIAIAARIEALIPSKAEREFLEAAMNYAARYYPRMDQPHGGDITGPFVDAYRALLAEREGKDG